MEREAFDGAIVSKFGDEIRIHLTQTFTDGATAVGVLIDEVAAQMTKMFGDKYVGERASMADLATGQYATMRAGEFVSVWLMTETVESNWIATNAVHKKPILVGEFQVYNVERAHDVLTAAREQITELEADNAKTVERLIITNAALTLAETTLTETRAELKQCKDALDFVREVSLCKITAEANALTEKNREQQAEITNNNDTIYILKATLNRLSDENAQLRAQLIDTDLLLTNALQRETDFNVRETTLLLNNATLVAETHNLRATVEKTQASVDTLTNGMGLLLKRLLAKDREITQIQHEAFSRSQLQATIDSGSNDTAETNSKDTAEISTENLTRITEKPATKASDFSIAQAGIADCFSKLHLFDMKTLKSREQRDEILAKRGNK
jgi:hypothetical protein